MHRSSAQSRCYQIAAIARSPAASSNTSLPRRRGVFSHSRASGQPNDASPRLVTTLDITRDYAVRHSLHVCARIARRMGAVWEATLAADLAGRLVYLAAGAPTHGG